MKQIQNQKKFDVCVLCIKNESLKQIYTANFKATGDWKNPFTGNRDVCVWCEFEFEMNLLNQKVKK